MEQQIADTAKKLYDLLFDIRFALTESHTRPAKLTSEESALLLEAIAHCHGVMTMANTTVQASRKRSSQ